jgi:glucokinase
MSSQVAYIGLDIGGTALKGGVVAKDGSVLARHTASTDADSGPDTVIARVIEMVEALSSAAAARGLRIASIGLGVPGLVSRESGVVRAAPNLPGWKDVPLGELLHRKAGLRVTIDNDANNAALGEFIAGAGHGARDLVMLTLGTGVGSGLILDGRLWHGATGHAGEIGHMIVQPDGRVCGCGQHGCLEAYASAASTARRAEELVAAGEPSTLKAVLDRGEVLDSKHVVEAAKAGDALSLRIWDESCKYLAIACISIQRILSPQAVVFSGGMSKAGTFLLDPLQVHMDRISSKSFGRIPEVRIAELGNDAGFIGSALNEPWHAAGSN